jgi:hypothetical protein
MKEPQVLVAAQTPHHCIDPKNWVPRFVLVYRLSRPRRQHRSLTSTRSDAVRRQPRRDWITDRNQQARELLRLIVANREGCGGHP